MIDYFGETHPAKLPRHYFSGALKIEYSTAIRATITEQDYTVCPRHWYVDAQFRCDACKAEYLWSAEEQRVWFETYHFYVDSRPKLCHECRARHRDAIELRKEYDSLVSAARSGGTVEEKTRIIEIVDDLMGYLNCVPEKMRQTRDVFLKQVSKH